MTDTDVTATDLAAAFGVSTRSIRDLATRGIVVRTDRGRYRFVESSQRYVAHLRAMAAGQGGDEGSMLTTERVALARERREAQALKNAAFRETMVSSADAAAEWSDIAEALRTRMQEIPARLRRLMPHLPAHDFDVIGEEIALALTPLGPSLVDKSSQSDAGASEQ